MEQAASVQAAADRLREEFALLDDWRDKVEYIIELGKELPPLPDGSRPRATRCAAARARSGWWPSPRPGGRIHLRADSDAILVKG